MPHATDFTRRRPAASWRSERRASGYTRADLEPLSFDDLPLGGEWTTRRRTVSESDIALYAGLAGDFSPLTIEATPGSPRTAPPPLIVAMAIGLGSMDMPVPSVAEWEWLNWRFPRAVRAGETIYARWTLTQKRPPAHDAASSIVVWRVDVHTSDGSLCADGEVGAKIRRQAQGAARSRARESTATAGSPVPQPSRRRRRRHSGNGQAPEVIAAAGRDAAAPGTAAKAPETNGAPSKRRRRRRSGGEKTAAREAIGNDSASAAAAGSKEKDGPKAAPESPATPTAGAAPAAAQSALSKVISRLRG